MKPLTPFDRMRLQRDRRENWLTRRIDRIERDMHREWHEERRQLRDHMDHQPPPSVAFGRSPSRQPGTSDLGRLPEQQPEPEQPQPRRPWWRLWSR